MNSHEAPDSLPLDKFRTGKPISRVNRSKSMYGAQASSQFGPKGLIAKTKENTITICDPATQRLVWDKPPLNILVIHKINDDKIIEPFIQLLRWIIEEKHLTAFVEKKSFEGMTHCSQVPGCVIKKACTFEDGKDDLMDKIDLIITLGGDGTLLYASSLFQYSVPPIMSFHLGSLGFLSPFNFTDFKESLNQVLAGNVPLCLRIRLKCLICSTTVKPSGQVLRKHPSDTCQRKMAMNEVVVDRGPSSYLCFLDLYIDSKYVTSVQGDGLIISTPTGSTAYAAAAGASMVHPSVPAIVIVPICAHSLSFRPIVIPAGVEVQIALNEDAREPAWMSFDGRSRTKLVPGGVLRISTCSYPIPSISAVSQMTDWFDSLASCLHWNVRKPQKSLTNLNSHNSENGESPPSPIEEK